MTDIRTMNSSVGPAEGAEQIEKVRKNIGGGFTDKPTDKKKRNEMGKDDFMKLMSAQLKYQDPISPMKNEEMAAQLAQFSSLEQMFNVNQNLEKMAAGQKPQENVLAASLIGKKVLTDGSRMHLEKDKSAEITFELPADAAKGAVSVVNGKGEVVREIPLSAAKKGLQSIRWDGKSDKGVTQDPGEYSFRVNAVDNQEKPIKAELSNAGIVTGISFEKGKPLLLVGDKKLSMETVSKIEEATAKDMAQLKAASTLPNMADAKSATPAAASSTEEKNKVSETDKQKDLSQAQPQSTIEDKVAEAPAPIRAKSAAAPRATAVNAPESETGIEPQELAMNANPAIKGNSLWNPNN